MHAHLYGIDLTATHDNFPAEFRRRRKSEKTCPHPGNAIIELLIRLPNRKYMSGGVWRPRLMPGEYKHAGYEIVDGKPRHFAHGEIDQERLNKAWASLPPEVVGDRVLSITGDAPAPPQPALAPSPDLVAHTEYENGVRRAASNAKPA